VLLFTRPNLQLILKKRGEIKIKRDFLRKVWPADLGIKRDINILKVRYIYFFYKKWYGAVNHASYSSLNGARYIFPRSYNGPNLLNDYNKDFLTIIKHEKL